MIKLCFCSGYVYLGDDGKMVDLIVGWKRNKMIVDRKGNTGECRLEKEQRWLLVGKESYY